MWWCRTIPFTLSSLDSDRCPQRSSVGRRSSWRPWSFPLRTSRRSYSRPRGLVLSPNAIRARMSTTSVDEARHALLAIPEMGSDEEPEGLAWFTFGASVAWIYAADANTTSPSDGVVHTFNRVSDLLDAIDDDLGDTGLLNELLRATGDMGRTAESWSTLAEGVRGAVDRLGSR
jgi:hypothetical protein